MNTYRKAPSTHCVTSWVLYASLAALHGDVQRASAEDCSAELSVGAVGTSADSLALDAALPLVPLLEAPMLS